MLLETRVIDTPPSHELRCAVDQVDPELGVGPVSIVPDCKNDEIEQTFPSAARRGHPALEFFVTAERRASFFAAVAVTVAVFVLNAAACRVHDVHVRLRQNHLSAVEL